MPPSNPVEFADHLSRRRPFGVAVAALYFVTIQPFVHPSFGPGDSRARGFGWAFNAAVLLLLLTPINGIVWGRRIRELVNDEVARAHARTALSAGFWLAMTVALVLFALPASGPMAARQAIYLVVTPAVAGALLLFAWLEWRAFRDG